MSGLLKEYRVTVTTVAEQFEYVVEAEDAFAADREARSLAYADGWKGFGSIETQRI